MSLMLMVKKCDKCNRSYNWNPDAGQFRCPNCDEFLPVGDTPNFGEVPDLGVNSIFEKKSFSNE